MRNPDSRFRPRPEAPSLLLVLRLEDGSPWSLTVSPGTERFIGHYPLVDGLDSGGPLLHFQIADPA